MNNIPALTQIVTYMGIIGIPSIFAMTVWCIRMCTKFMKTLGYLMAAEKSDIRNQLIIDYEKYEERCKNGGDITLVELDEWLNRYKAYHNLVGDNGVLDNKYNKILELKLAKSK